MNDEPTLTIIDSKKSRKPRAPAWTELLVYWLYLQLFPKSLRYTLSSVNFDTNTNGCMNILW
jgi:hypothetical protein